MTHFFRPLSAVIATLSIAGSFASTRPPDADERGDIQASFADSREFTTVRVTSLDELIAAMIAAGTHHRPTVIDVAPGHYFFSVTSAVTPASPAEMASGPTRPRRLVSPRPL
jgi:hypothetical protein